LTVELFRISAVGEARIGKAQTSDAEQFQSSYAAAPSLAAAAAIKAVVLDDKGQTLAVAQGPETLPETVLDIVLSILLH
jgi:hypothetical protein